MLCFQGGNGVAGRIEGAAPKQPDVCCTKRSGEGSAFKKLI
jgi:hypothetical protein